MWIRCITYFASGAATFLHQVQHLFCTMLRNVPDLRVFQALHDYFAKICVFNEEKSTAHILHHEEPFFEPGTVPFLLLVQHLFCTKKSIYCAPGTAPFMHHQVQQQLWIRCITYFAPGTAPVLHKAQQLFCIRRSNNFASGTAPILHQVQHLFCNRRSNNFASGLEPILDQAQQLFNIRYSTYFAPGTVTI